ncbi:MAG TPA: LamG-like jellyroll fold domain-containing protein [Verrucomicrobiales bacterium]|nr:LamG-like jellyroll fold domain-containing protein [Verrucomicrobiales bacterium]
MKKTAIRGFAAAITFSAATALPGAAALVGKWTFENGSLADSTGNFGNLVLQGNATIVNGALDLNGSDTTAGGWACTPGGAASPFNSGPGGGTAISSKTLVAWVTLQGLSTTARAGAVISLDSITADKFDGIVFSETPRTPADNWMNGSTGWSRSPAGQFNQTSVSTETSTGTMIQLAITYQVTGSTVVVTGYRNGVVMGTYSSGSAASWTAGDQEVMFGPRHISPAYAANGGIDALIHEARLYNTTLSQAEIQALQLTDNSDTDDDGLPDQWEMSTAGNLTSLTGRAGGPGPGAGTGDFDGDGLSDTDELAHLTNPLNADTDGDTLNDKAEIAGAGGRPPTSPVNPDTDGDGLSDAVETGDGNYAGPLATGTNPAAADTDGDGYSDGTEVTILHSNPLQAASPAFAETLLGQWTFESGSELKDLKGNYPDLVLMGDAAVENGALHVRGSGTSMTGWAHTGTAGGNVPVGSKTLISWITLDSLGDAAKDGSALTLDSAVTDKFDGIVFGEKSVDNWMNGSTNWLRSPNGQFDQTAVSTETAPGTRIMLAITYKDLSGGQVEITGYRNGVPMGTYNTPNFATWTAGEQEVVFGSRHTDPLPPYCPKGGLNALIHEARIYGKAATAEEIAALFAAGPVEGSPLTLTGISYNALTGSVNVTWTSHPGKTYRLEYTADFTAWTPAATGYPAGGATEPLTSYQFQGLPSSSRRFFRVVEE